ncbi:MAG: SDR family oxidoreductase [Candidatus Bathyarchaeia archaeon]
MRVLVTGGAGFIGSHTVDRLLAENFEVTVLDNMRSGRLENIRTHIGEKNFRFVQGDIRDSCLVKKLVSNTDYVIHLAALVSVSESIRDPVLTHEVNVNGTLNLLRACIDFDVKRFIYASSCAVYGNAKKLPIKEEHPTKPKSPYGLSKLTAENYVRKYFEEFNLETVCLRYFNVYGPRQVHSEYSGVISQFLNRIQKSLPLKIFGDGEQTRDFVYVEDVAEANLLALKRSGIAGEIFNIGTGAAISINQLAKMFLEIADKKHLEIRHCEARKGDIRHSVADISKAKKKLGYKPKTHLKDGIKQFFLHESYV